MTKSNGLRGKSLNRLASPLSTQFISLFSSGLSRLSQAESVEDILRRVDALPRLEGLREEDILGYDENGIPKSGH
ncbi:MAG TPA: hypothetical protein VGI16_02405 [Candidatus Acidoferrum sp.]|jgi:hypothetical protein